MPVHYTVGSLRSSLPSEVSLRIRRTIAVACSKIDAGAPIYVFFRADDVAVPSQSFVRLMDLFARKHIPLSLAVVPAWLTRPRWRQIRKIGQTESVLWCWHQHGWRHANHEPTGKKQEFGPSRTQDHAMSDLIRGRRRLETLMEDYFEPIFTPPWNRCDGKTLRLLKSLDYIGVSRSHSDQTPGPEGLPDFGVNVDLHTRKAADPGEAREDLFRELEAALGSRLCGIMIHHQRMNEADFSFLEIFLNHLLKNKKCYLTHLKELMAMDSDSLLIR